jgi:hypothetical protein
MKPFCCNTISGCVILYIRQLTGSNNGFKEGDRDGAHSCGFERAGPDVPLLRQIRRTVGATELPNKKHFKKADDYE